MRKKKSKSQGRVYFAIDLDAKRPEVLEFSGEELLIDLKIAGTSDPLKLSDYDRRVFRTEKEVEKYLGRFNKALNQLHKLADGKWSPGPSLIYRRHYLVQTAMGEKLQTYRDYKRGWKTGQLLKLYDQTFYIMVRLKNISKTSGGYKYSFTLLK